MAEMTIEQQRALAIASARMRAAEAENNGGFGEEIKNAELAQSRAQMTHPMPVQKPQDVYSQQARNDTFMQNVGAGAGGAMYGVLNLGPRQIAGMTKQEEYEDLKASMGVL